MLIALSIVAAVAGLLGWLLVFYDNGQGGFAHRPAAARADEEFADGSLRTVWFPAQDGTRLEGWLFLPRTVSPALVVMAPGLTGTKQGHLEPFARRFLRAGLAVLIFDFRTLGGSEGEPRHWIDPERQLHDWHAALAFVRKELAPARVVDGSRVALWGSSFSGGTALVAAAQDRAVSAVVAQCPFLATPPQLEPGPWAMAHFAVWTVLDSLRASLGLRPIYVAAFGRPGESLVFAKSRENPSARGFRPGDAHEFWRSMPDPLRGGWQNKLAARVFASLDRVVPMEHVAELHCPVYLVAGAHDDMVPAEFVRTAYERLPNAAKQLSVHDCGHFDLYLGDVFSENAERQAAFLTRALAPLATATG
jgi:pimeloyl-ACP methyl ester carboxylesterase